MNFDRYTDVYFLRSVQILQHYDLNPFVRAQVFLRQGPGSLWGITEVLDLIKQQSELIQNGGKVFALSDKDEYNAEETFVVIEGRAQDVIPLETVLLGIMSAETTRLNDHQEIDLSSITKRVREIKEQIGKRDLYYFGARHWHYSQDKEISKAVFDGGVVAASTNEGASIINRKGIGTIPHSLENIFAWKYGLENAVLETTLAFDNVMDTTIPRVALVDYANKEIEDSLKVARELGNKLYGIRIDTCGENLMQGAELGTKKYWQGNGVTVTGVRAVRKALDEAGFNEVKIILSSGFGELEKVQEFVKAEKILGIKLFDALGVGNLFNARIATMDVVGVGENLERITLVSKVGRSYKPNPRLKQVL